MIERTLFNVVATAVSREGDRFFYTNTVPADSGADLDRLIVSTATPPRYSEGSVVVSAGWLPEA